MMIYVAAGLVLAALVAMASGRVDPLLALLVVLILVGILGIAATAAIVTPVALRLASNMGVDPRDRWSWGPAATQGRSSPASAPRSSRPAS
jgi:hypothetical protein